MRTGTCARFVCLLTLLATPAAAQSTTEDGIRAIVGGDYQAAVRILRPLADDAARPDPVAEFFLAIVYGSGERGDYDPRVCGLYLRAARRPNPFSDLASALAAAMQERFGRGASLMCVADESWQGGPAQSFVLGPDHRVVFADTSITVTYRDLVNQTPVILHSSTAFLPIEYTSLDVRRPVPARRHFFQWFEWMPDTAGDRQSWTLAWMLSEVVGGQWMPIMGEKSLTVVNGPAPPTSYDVARLVHLRVNEAGEAELTIMRGTSPHTEVIPLRGSR